MGHGVVGALVPRLAEWRDRKLMTQEELAQAAGVSRVTVNRAERGERVSYETVRGLASALGVSTDDLRYAVEPQTAG